MSRDVVLLVATFRLLLNRISVVHLPTSPTPFVSPLPSGSIDIDLCASIYTDLKQACDRGLILANTLHLLYLVTPYDLVASSNPNWVIYDRLVSAPLQVFKS